MICPIVKTPSQVEFIDTLLARDGRLITRESTERVILFGSISRQMT